MSKSHPTNVEFLKKTMEESRHGVLMQVVVLTALQVYTDLVLENPEEMKKEMQHGLISGDTWVNCCQELHDRLKLHNTLMP